MFKKYIALISYSVCLSTNLFSMENEIKNNSFQTLFKNTNPISSIDLSKIMDPALENEDKSMRQLELIKVAADLGHANALYAISSFYLRGIGLEKNINLAYDYLKLGEKNSVVCSMKLQAEASKLHLHLLNMIKDELQKDDKPISFNFLNTIESEIKIFKLNNLINEVSKIF